jgi:hypothetical protein
MLTGTLFVVRMSRGTAGPADKEPTFQEFIHFLLNTEIYSDDEHWQPIALRCRSAQPIGKSVCFTETNTVLCLLGLPKLFIERSGRERPKI